MEEPQGLQRVREMTLGDVGRGLARYRSLIALAITVALVALVLPQHKGASKVGAGHRASTDRLRGSASATSAGSDTLASSGGANGVTASGSAGSAASRSGRTVKLVRYDRTGTDDSAGKADAQKCAKEIKGFMALDTENNAYTEEIVANHLLCFCTVTMSKDYYLRRAPYVWGTGLEDYDQEFSLVTEMISKQINAQKAKYAGDATMQLKDRAFGFVHYDTADNAYSGAAA